MAVEPYHGAVYDTLPEEAWQRKKRGKKIETVIKQRKTKNIIRSPEERKVALTPSYRREIIETEKRGPVYVPKGSPYREKPKKTSWLGRFGRKTPKTYKPGHAKIAKQKGKVAWRSTGNALTTSRHAIRRGGETAAKFGYALPGPVQIFVLAWQKTTKALKWLTILVFALVLLFVPVGVFSYAGWAVGAAFMFLLSLIFWVFVNLFNGLASILVTIINGIASIIMGAIIWVIEAIMDFFMTGEGYYWTNGHELLDNALIKYSQIANVPELYHIVTPTWEPWMNEPLFAHLMGMLGISFDLSWIGAPIRAFYSGLPVEQAMIIGLAIIIAPIAFLIYIYYKNRHVLAG